MSSKRLFFLFSIEVLLILLLMTGCLNRYANYPDKGYTSPSMKRAAMRSYVVLGKSYRPTYVSVGQTMRGISSWYGPNFHGKYTSSGEHYNMYAKTAAHKTWPMDTMVKIINLQNGKSTIARINDRGPFVKGRIIDCSYATGKELGLDKTGIAKVKIEVVGFAGKVQTSQQITKAKAEKKIERIRLTNFGIQVGAFSRYEGAKITKKKYKRIGMNRYHVVIKRAQDNAGRTLYRVFMMGFKSKKAARDYRDNYLGLSGAPILRS
ncbi:MAG: septal ring lytic transglycosylase RlpA family protein [Sulfurovum sp.]|nr:septal ring lytic transglycosylase RlpA family protein [Sulfurovum sp.]MCB4763436.1 septal ring lytic transglycosylase RlpA family protein [Sulfurovum sp.]MCB4776788.1 septal ring lytic transglycosylase RlpA family protein [Sulfurovum sp.]MCB4778438.1 septal ring lytic transglycosylase RlpA family protein [Sulfurovum sp.]